MNINDAEKQVINILVENFSIHQETISSDTDILKDLGLDGDDAVELFEVISKTLGVDFSGLEWEKHFGPEASFNPFELLNPSWWRWQGDRIPITVHDLAKSVMKKSWLNP